MWVAKVGDEVSREVGETAASGVSCESRCKIWKLLRFDADTTSKRDKNGLVHRDWGLA
jgi:hypothetical protein